MKRLFVPVATAPYRRFEAGTKTVEVRAATSPVARAVLARAEIMEAAGTPVLLRRGYSTPDQMTGRLGRVWPAASLAALPEEARAAADLQPGWSVYFDGLRPVVAFEILGLQP